MKRVLVLAALALCPGAQSAAPKVPAFDHVIVIVFENKARAEVLGSPAAPAFNAFAKRGAVLSDYRGLVHPSLPNYLALVSGSMHGIAWNCTSCTVAGRSLADALEAKGLTWKAYAEGLPRPGWTGLVSGRYAKKHEPFLYFRRVLASRARLRRVVPLAQLSRDLAAKRLPDFALVTPDMCHDMHDCPVSTGDAWLGRFLPPLLRLPGHGRRGHLRRGLRSGSGRARAGARARSSGRARHSCRRSRITACCGRSRTGSALLD